MRRSVAEKEKKLAKRPMTLTLAAVGAAAVLTIPAAPATAKANETCHYEPVSCACRIVVTVLRDLTGDPWTCAD